MNEGWDRGEMNWGGGETSSDTNRVIYVRVEVSLTDPRVRDGHMCGP